MTSSQLVSDLSEENHRLSKQLIPTSMFSWTERDCNKLKDSYYKLLSKVNGFPPRQDFIGIELAITYNYCYMGVLTKCMTLDNVQRVDEAVTQQPNVILKEKTYSLMQPAVGDVIANCVERINLLKKQFAPTYTVLERPNTMPAQQLLNEISSSWFPTEVKGTAISLINVYILDLLRDSNLSLASELSTNLLSFGESALDSIIQAAQVNYRLAVLPFVPRDAVSQACSYLKEEVHVIAAIVLYRNEHWSSSLDILQRCLSIELSDFCCYLRGIILCRQNDYISSARVLSDLCERRDIHPVICYAATRLLGDCFSAQGKHHSAIQMYKRCLLKDFSLLMPLYHIAEQYRCLGLTDAEIESLQLLTKLLHNSQAESLEVNTTNGLLFGVSRLLSYIAVQEDSISESQAVYVLAKRCADIGRYEVSAEKYSQVLSSWNDAVSGNLRNCFKFHIPTVRVIYLESVRVHMKACLFQKVVALCSKYLTKIAWVENCSRNESGSDFIAVRNSKSMNNESTLFKRCITYEEDGYDVHAGEAVAARIALHHAEALLHLEKYEEASDSIESTLKNIEFFIIDDQLIRPPPMKKKRMEQDENIDINERRELQLLLSDGYSLKARILSALDPSVNVLHWTRLAAALDTDSVEKAYSLTQALIRLNRKLEASSYWLSKRGIDTTALDCYQIDVAIKQRSSLSCSEDIANSTGTLKELTSRYLAMDLEALNQLRIIKHGF